MDYTRQLLLESAERTFAAHCSKKVLDSAEAGNWPSTLWNTLTDLGFFSAVVPEAQGGLGLGLIDVLEAVRLSGRYLAPIPFAETIVSGWLLGIAQFDIPSGPMAFGPVTRKESIVVSRAGGRWVIDGQLSFLPWGDKIKSAVVVAQTEQGGVIVKVDPSNVKKIINYNLAGEERTHLLFDKMPLQDDHVTLLSSDSQLTSPLLLGGILRSLQTAGALQLILDLSVRYAGERIAFDQPLNKLPAVQQNLAILAGQVAAANVAADMLLDALADSSKDIMLPHALARVRINQGAEVVARLAHQIHGAIGFTHEHLLHHGTRRVWSWRDEFSHETYWSEVAGHALINAGSDQFWSSITEAAQL